MKNFVIACIALISSALSSACPTCIGRLDTDSPPFFSENYHKSHKTYGTQSQRSQQKVEVSKDVKKTEAKKEK